MEVETESANMAGRIRRSTNFFIVFPAFYGKINKKEEDMITGLTKFERFIANQIFIFGTGDRKYYDGTAVEWSITISIIETILIATAILAIIGVIILIRQQKIMKMLRDLTPPKAESPREEDTAAKETE